MTASLSYPASYVVAETLSQSTFPPIEEVIFGLERDTVLKSLYLPFEKSYDGIPVLRWSMQHFYLGPVFAALYLGAVYFGRKWMAKRKPYDLRGPLKYWNLFLAAFSFCGAVRTAPHLLALLFTYGWPTTLCGPPVLTYGRGAAGFWTMLFIYSKYFELADTAFIILRKKHLSFLHWYHHATVLLYTWDAFVTAQPPGLYFIAMNYTVHAVMYFYYYLSALSKPPKWGIIVTIMQIAQMIAGVVITVTATRLVFAYPHPVEANAEVARDPLAFGTCHLAKSNVLSAVGMYSTYFYLFAEFFVKRYFIGSSKTRAHSKKNI